MRRPEDIVGLHHLIDELLSRIEHLEAGHERLSLETEQLREENVQLREENARLKRQVGQDSQNSHRPPFSEDIAKSQPFPSRVRSVGAVVCAVIRVKRCRRLRRLMWWFPCGLKSVRAVRICPPLPKVCLRVANALICQSLVWW